ncbi:hypothetical protein BH10PSE2_BH10PSE2_29600 [soil metagenome]
MRRTGSRRVLPVLGAVVVAGIFTVGAERAVAQAATADGVAAAPSAATLRQGVAGRWVGALGYRDYQTNELFELPVITTIVAVGDGLTLVQTSRFDDGPGKEGAAKVVWITTTSLDDAAASTTTQASYRAGETVELETEAVAVRTWSDATHWTLIYSHVGSDDDAPADIRITETRDGDALLSVKEVRPVGSDEAAWRFRNQTRLTRSVD